MSSTLVPWKDVLEESLTDDEFREDWERTAFARAVAQQVIRYRIEKNMTQTAVARLVGVSQAVIGRLELGEHEPKVSTLRRLSEKLGLSFSIDIHPLGKPITTPVAGATVERLAVNGVELVVATA
jgi:transcriptional regulator with XRE-family HTH domain